MLQRLFPLFVLVIFSCKGPSAHEETFSLKDSITRRYLASIDTLDFYDTIDHDYKILKAYVNNDTGFFENMKREMDLLSQYLYPPGLDSCVFPLKLSDLPAEEAYRFIYDQSFCPAGQAITISRVGKLISLHYAKYLLPERDGRETEFILDNGKRYHVKSNCVLIKESIKSLTEKDWDNLEVALRNADYWGLKEVQYDACVDGSDRRIDAYVKKGRFPFNQKVHSVRRHCSGSRDFRELGSYFLKLSGEKTLCRDFF